MKILSRQLEHSTAFYYEEQPQMQAEVILASNPSYSSAGPIVTLRGRYPRPIHGEVLTHKKVAKNARSSRAVPVNTMLHEVMATPYIPWHWHKNKKGMQGTESLTINEILAAKAVWMNARDDALYHTQLLKEMDIHKQNPNRLLEPFSWIDTLMTATDWSNFFWLRNHGDAEPHLQDFARLALTAISKAKFNHLREYEWHQPYVYQKDIDYAKLLFHTSADRNEWLNKISAARCARISYAPFNGDSTHEAEAARYDMLVNSDRVHASPTEHQARADFRIGNEWELPELHGNLTGYVQARKLIPNEACTTPLFDMLEEFRNGA